MHISHVAKITKLTTKQIRDYEKAELLPSPMRSEAGYRIYSQDEVERLLFIRNARKVGFSLKQIKQLLTLHRDKQRTSREVKALTEQHICELKAKIADLEKRVALLQSWSNACWGNDTPDCPILTGLTDEQPYTSGEIKHKICKKSP